MKKTIKNVIGLSLFLNLVNISIINAQDHELHDEKLNGRVKTLTKFTYQSMNGNARATANYLTSKSIQKYNEQGRIKEFIWYRRTGHIEYIDTYTYNTRGFLISDKSINYSEPNDSEKEEMMYDTAGNEIEIRIYNASNEQKSLSRLKYEGKT